MIRVQYFQGPGTALGLVLGIARPGEADFHAFSTRDYLPPANSEEGKK